MKTSTFLFFLHSRLLLLVCYRSFDTGKQMSLITPRPNVPSIHYIELLTVVIYTLNDRLTNTILSSAFYSSIRHISR
jgi:hypothetical protein